ncbi:MAG: cobalamin-dependent protein [Bdellovibrionaceae bacterium]|nr:cobalamin-dependent protein [Pseudobdellovibrionaceae bacterium]
MKYKNPIRVVTAAALFDGHDATINIIRRILQDQGAEVIHLGHNRSVKDVVKAVIQEGAQGVCVSSYQGGHMEYFKYLKDLLDDCGLSHVKIFGGGGGVIVWEEKLELERYGINQIFHPDDGRRLGLVGMISTIMDACDFDPRHVQLKRIPKNETYHKTFGSDPIPQIALGRALSAAEMGQTVDIGAWDLENFKKKGADVVPVIGITGTGGAGKSSLIDELALRFLHFFPHLKLGIACVDPSKRKTGGALLGDRIRMNSLSRDRIFMRSLATRGSGMEISKQLVDVLDIYRQLDFDLIIAETSGIGQASSQITDLCDIPLYVMTSEYGAASQLEKIDMIDYAHMIAINKSDRKGSLDALKAVQKQFKRSRKLFDETGDVPVFLTQAAQFNDSGVNQLFFEMIQQVRNFQLNQKKSDEAVQRWALSEAQKKSVISGKSAPVIPGHRTQYLLEITNSVRNYKKRVQSLSDELSIVGSLSRIGSTSLKDKINSSDLESYTASVTKKLDDSERHDLFAWDQKEKIYAADEMVFKVRDKEFKNALTTTSLSGSKIRKVVFPKFRDWGDRFRFLKLENVPGEFPYTAGVFPLKRADEDPKRMFAGEGPPERTNKRFHFLCEGETAHRLSTAFDSVTLYGQDPDVRPDIFGKVGESGVSICSLGDMKKLYDGFDLCSPNTSVSMTINGPAPIILAFFFNTAFDQQVVKKEKELGRALNAAESEALMNWTLQNVRGTVQADILKEDQGQNTCIFSIQFALKMMGDIQEYFVQKSVKNFYSVSISGYHIAEAGANPISQLAFTLSNGFTFVEYYLNRGMNIDDFAANLSFFFSNGLDPEYTVLGRVARRIWAIAMKDLYKANDRSQKLKYHIQTSGRSLHAQEIAFNDIRTTLQALLAIQDNCNSLHTNAYDEAITTPTQESVRRAMAIQMIINREFGNTKNENTLQGSFYIDELTDLVEEAVLEEFLRINERGGVLGAMETQYQRSKIQEESLYYEKLKHDGTLPIIGVNTFIDPATLQADYAPPKIELARASYEEKQLQLDRVTKLKTDDKRVAEALLNDLKSTALKGENIFGALMRAARHCSLYQMTQALYEVGGEYRRNV